MMNKYRWLRYGVCSTILLWILTPLIGWKVSAYIMFFTGWIATITLLCFWVLPLLRLFGIPTSSKTVHIHELLGLGFLVPLTIHGSQYGNSWMLGIGLLALTTLWIGQSKSTSEPQQDTSIDNTQNWWRLHIVLAFVLTAIIGLHIGYVIAYS